MINAVSTVTSCGVVRSLDCMRVLSQLQQFPLFPNCFVFNAFSKFIRDIRTWSFRESGSSGEDGQTVGTVTRWTALEILLVHGCSHEQKSLFFILAEQLRVLTPEARRMQMFSLVEPEFLTAGFRGLLDQKLRKSAHKFARLFFQKASRHFCRRATSITHYQYIYNTQLHHEC